MTDSRLSRGILGDLHAFTAVTAGAWMDGSMIKPNSWGTVVLVAPQPGSDFTDHTRHPFGNTRTEAEHTMGWYVENADGKNIICLGTGMDSHEAVRLWQGLVRQLQGAFPWGGAVIDIGYGLIVGTSGFKEDEDLLFSRTVRNRIVMMLDREGEDVLTNARERGKQQGEAGADRFTRRVSDILVPAPLGLTTAAAEHDSLCEEDFASATYHRSIVTDRPDADASAPGGERRKPSGEIGDVGARVEAGAQGSGGPSGVDFSQLRSEDPGIR